MTMSALRFGVATLILVAWLAPAPVAAQTQKPTTLRLTTSFGDEVIVDSCWVPVLAVLENRTRRDLSGVLVLDDTSEASRRYELPVDLPAGETRQVAATVFAEGQLRGQFMVGDRPASEPDSLVVSYGGHSVVILGEGTRLRGALLDLRAYDRRGGYDAYEEALQEVVVGVGTATFDRGTGDPMLPEDAAAYGSVRLLVAHVPALRLTNDRQRAAIVDWVASGGRLLIFPRTPEDVHDAFVQQLVGDVTAREASADQPALVPTGVARVDLGCAPGAVAETFGCSRGLGFGRVFLASYDGMSNDAVDSGVTRELVRSVYTPRGTQTVLPFSSGRDDLTDEWTDHSIGVLRAALDPNEAFRPGLLLVALLLFFYVIVVGPLNFRWVQRRNAPVLALVTTPVVAGVCVVLLVGVGYLGKGVSMRHRRVEVVELAEGTARGHARTYVGLFSTRPGSFDLVVPGGAVSRRLGYDPGRGPVHREGPEGIAMRDFRAGLWDTTFLREDRMVDFGGVVTFERDERRLVSVHNGTRHSLRGAVVVNREGYLFPVGTLGPGERGALRDSAGTLPTYGLGVEQHPARVLGDHMGLDPDHRAVLQGVMRLYEPRFIPEHAVLYAWIEHEPSTLGPFEPEIDLRFVRVVPVLPAMPVPPSEPVEAERNVDYGSVEDLGGRGAAPASPLLVGTEVSPDAATAPLDGGVP